MTTTYNVYFKMQGHNTFYLANYHVTKNVAMLKAEEYKKLGCEVEVYKLTSRKINL